MKKKEKKSKFRIFKISNIILIGIFCYFVTTFAEQQVSLNKYNSQIESYEAQIKAKKEELKLYIVDKENETSDEYVEKVARETLGLVKPYERIYIDVSK
ncbi:MAG: septum formation initiator family protein [Clostridia bacterium]|nr:septum formation initiator family protein [Clostridia bacterium]